MNWWELELVETSPGEETARECRRIMIATYALLAAQERVTQTLGTACCNLKGQRHAFVQDA